MRLWGGFSGLQVVAPATEQLLSHSHYACYTRPCLLRTAGRLIAVGGMTGARMRLQVSLVLGC